MKTKAFEEQVERILSSLTDTDWTLTVAVPEGVPAKLNGFLYRLDTREVTVVFQEKPQRFQDELSWSGYGPSIFYTLPGIAWSGVYLRLDFAREAVVEYQFPSRLWQVLGQLAEKEPADFGVRYLDSCKNLLADIWMIKENRSIFFPALSLAREEYDYYGFFPARYRGLLLEADLSSHPVTDSDRNLSTFFSTLFEEKLVVFFSETYLEVGHRPGFQLQDPRICEQFLEPFLEKLESGLWQEVVERRLERRKGITADQLLEQFEKRDPIYRHLKRRMQS